MKGLWDKEEPGKREADNQSSTGDERRLTIMNNRIDSRDLFTGTRDIVILHGNDAYHLRLTAQNKLILTKRTCLCVVCPID
jgi:hemin uptake protein HemP